MDKNYELFIEQLTNGIHELADIPMENMTFVKQGDRMAPDSDRLLVKIAEYEDAWDICGLRVEILFKQFEEKRPLQDIIEETVADIEHAKMTCSYHEVKELMNYRIAKDRTIIRPVNLNKNIADLGEYVYKAIGDIALVVCLLVAEGPDHIVTTKLPKGFLKGWNKREDDIFKEALDNTYKLTPPRIHVHNLLDIEFMASLIDDGDDFMSPSYTGELIKDFGENMLTTTKKANGAVAVFLPGVAKRLAELLGTDFYIVFTSVNEAMIHADTYIDPYELKAILVDTMNECTPKEERLTSKIYKYVSDENKFICVTD